MAGTAIGKPETGAIAPRLPHDSVAILPGSKPNARNGIDGSRRENSEPGRSWRLASHFEKALTAESLKKGLFGESRFILGSAMLWLQRRFD